ncbi:hypothetical protein JKP31_16125 [Vibrio vulnificus]|uniref:hypothetical protein n=1 Tax=Vibrio vulnificus TaxID=672 RepID=UPI001CDCB3AD|nr:hypothetical protein [Vibrio vulnificus]MCA3902825.1 hypothetical protein [Vibrio vulnificus]
MSIAYRLRHDDGKITEVKCTKRLMSLPDYSLIRTDADGVPLYKAPKEHLHSKPIESGRGVRGRLLAHKEQKQERAEFLAQLNENVELKQSFSEWKANKQASEKRIQKSSEYYEDLEKNSEILSEAEYEHRQLTVYEKESGSQDEQMAAEAAHKVVKTRLILNEKISLHSKGSGHNKIIASEAQAELEAINQQYDENGYPLDLPETEDESS